MGNFLFQKGEGVFSSHAARNPGVPPLDLPLHKEYEEKQSPAKSKGKKSVKVKWKNYVLPDMVFHEESWTARL